MEYPEKFSKIYFIYCQNDLRKNPRDAFEVDIEEIPGRSSLEIPGQIEEVNLGRIPAGIPGEILWKNYWNLWRRKNLWFIRPWNFPREIPWKVPEGFSRCIPGAILGITLEGPLVEPW